MITGMRAAHIENTTPDRNGDLASDDWVVVSLPFGASGLDLYTQRWSGSRERVCGDEALEEEIEADQWSIVSLPGEDVTEVISEFDCDLENSQTAKDDILVELGDSVGSESPAHNNKSNFIENSISLPPTLEQRTMVDLEVVESKVRADNGLSLRSRSRRESDSWARVRNLIQVNDTSEPCSVKTQKLAQTIQRAESTSKRLGAIRGLGLWDNPLLQHDYFTLEQQKMKILMRKIEHDEE